ncbi:MAG: putative siderophore-interacting protein, partial [Friedmanniella sp.]|nr:putative siderophore-interacting protein [Friedmanniella sp.]
PAETAWLLLAADLTGLPALARILRGLAPGVTAYAYVEVPELADRQPLPSPATLHLTWRTPQDGPGRLVADVRGFTPPAGPGYVWFAGEAADSRAVRRHVRGTLGWPVERYRSLGYWQRDKERWDRRYAEVGPGLESVYREAVAAGHSSTEALELYDEALAAAGL